MSDTITTPEKPTASATEPTDALSGETDPSLPVQDAAASPAEEAQSAPPAAPETPAAPTSFKVDGQDVPVSDLEDAYRYAEKAIEIRNESLKLQADTKKVLNDLKTDPGTTLLNIFSAAAGSNGKPDRDAGYNRLVDFCSEILSQHLKYQELPEEGRQALKLKAERDAAQAELDRIKAERDAELESQAAADNFAYWNPKIQAATKAAGLPADEDTLADIAEVLMEQQEAGFEPNADKAAARVKRLRDEKRKAVIPALTIDDLPPSLIEQIRARDLEQVRSGRPSAQTAPAAAAAPSGDKVFLPTRGAR